MATLTNTATASYQLLGVPLVATPVTATLEVLVDILNWSKTFTPQRTSPGSTVQVTITVTNPVSVLNPITNLIVTDVLPVGLTFVAGSVKIDGVSNPSAVPANGINVGTLNTNITKVITFDATVS